MNLSGKEKHFHELIELAPLPYHSLDAEGRFLEVNQAWQKILGYKKEEVMGKKFTEFLAPDCKKEFMNFFPLLKKSGTLTAEYIIHHKNGEKRNFKINGTIVRNPNGSFDRTHCLLNDITHEHQTIKKHQEHSRRFDFLSRAANEMLELPDLQSIYHFICTNIQNHYPGSIVLIVSVDEKKMETRLMDIAGLQNSFLQKAIKISGFNPLGKTYRVLPGHQKIWKTGNLHEFKGGLAGFASTEFPSPAAKTIHKILSIHKIYTIGINKGNNLLSAVHIITREEREISEKKFIESFVKQAGIIIQRKILEDELRYQSMILNQINDQVTVMDTNGIITYINNATERMMQRSSGEILGKPVDIFGKNQKTGPALRQIMEKTLQNGSWRGEIIRTDSQENESFYDFRTKLIRDKTNNPIGMSGIATDISEHKRVWERMVHSEANARAFMEATNDVLILIDKNFRVTDTNEAHARRFGMTRDALIGQSMDDFLPADVAQRRKDWIMQVIQKGESITCEDHRDGYWYDCTISPVRNSSGEVDRVAVFSKDVTSRKLSEIALKRSAEKWDKTFQSMQTGITLLDNNQQIIQSNLSFREFIGESESELRGKQCFHLVHGTHHPVKECPFLKMKKSRQPESVEMQIKEKVYKVSVDPIFDDQGDMTGAVHNMWDITQQKRELEIKKLVFQMAKTSALSTKLEDLLLFIRKELGNLVDTTNFYVALHTPETDMLQKIVFLNKKDDFVEWKASESIAGKVIQTGETLLLNNEEQIREASQNRTILGGIPAKCWLGVPLKVKRKTIGVMVVKSNTNTNAFCPEDAKLMEMIAHEISSFIERRNMVKDLVEAKEKAEESDRLKSAFLANMSHEIRTPMNGILGFIDLLNEPGLEEKNRATYMDVLKESSQRLMNTIDDIIQISKIEVGEWEVILTVANPREIMEYYLNFFGPKARQKGIALTIAEQPDEEKSLIRTDRAKLDGILTNLINNALKFTDKGSIELGCHIEGEFLFFYVKDTGKGIPAEKLDAIFDRFVQADTNLTRGHEGSGLGLSIVKASAEILGGKVWVESEINKGSTFWFSIPYDPVPLKKATAYAGTKEIEYAGVKEKQADFHETTSRNKKETVLICEDNQVSLLYLKTILEKENFRIIQTTTGEEAVKIVKKNPDIDLILMDVKMPGMSGLEATTEIRRFNQDIPIIAQTAHALESDKARALKAGCNGYISKPVRREDLINIVQHYIHPEN